MLPQLARVLSEYDTMNIVGRDARSFRPVLAATILAASRFSDNSWKTEAIDRTKQVLEGSMDCYMKAWLASRESAVLRMFGKWDESDEVLRAFVQSTVLAGHDQESETSPRYNSQRGELVISFAENLIRRGKIEEAKNELSEWSPLDLTAPSTLERLTLRARDIILGKALRYQGCFAEALSLLEKLLEESHVDDFFEGTGWYRVLLSGIADSYCELGRGHDAEELVRRELQPMIERGTQDIATGRRLRMSLAEAFLERGMFNEAEETLLRLKTVYEATTRRGHTMDISFFRVCVGLARTSHRQARWHEALSYWDSALATAKRLKIGEGANAGIVRYSMAHALLMMGNETESNTTLEEAKRNMSTEHRLFWIAGFSSRWHDFIVKIMT